MWGTENMSVPVLLSVPHAGRDYPADVFDALRVPPASLVRLEDRYADLLVRLKKQQFDIQKLELTSQKN